MIKFLAGCLVGAAGLLAWACTTGRDEEALYLDTPTRIVPRPR